MPGSATRPASAVSPGVENHYYLNSRRFYTDSALFELEMSRIVPDSWIFVGDVAELSEPGDFISMEIGHEPVVVVRDDELQLRAYRNVCPHRGSTLTEGTGNCGARIECPYHGWRFRLDGSLAATPFRRHFDAADGPGRIGLGEIAVDVWERLVFVKCTGATPGLHDCLEELPGLFRGFRLRDATLVFHSRERYEVNWKLWADISFDSYHLPFVHNRTIGRDLDLRDVEMHAGPLHTSYGLARMAGSSADNSSTAGRALFAYFYPALQISADPSGAVLLASATPEASETVRVTVATYVPNELAQSLPVADLTSGAAAELYRAVRQEDLDQCRRVAATLRSSAPVTGPVNLLSLPEAHFHGWLRHMYAKHIEHAHSLGVAADLLTGLAESRPPRQ